MKTGIAETTCPYCSSKLGHELYVNPKTGTVVYQGVLVKMEPSHTRMILEMRDQMPNPVRISWSDQSAQVAVARIRSVLPKGLKIITVRGKGYRLKVET